MSTETKEQIIIEFITKMQGRAFDNKFGVCFLCGGTRTMLENGAFKPKHSRDCLFSRAEKVVYQDMAQL